MIKAGGRRPSGFKNIFSFQLLMPEVNEKIRINKAAR
jgi:hypothetical protein